MKNKRDAPSGGKILDRVRSACRMRHLSLRTEKAYVAWIKRFVHFHALRHPATMGAAEIRTFLTYLAVERNVAASTQNQALSALLFLYRHVLEQDLGDLGEVVRARRPKRLPVVLSREEVRALLDALQGTHRFVASLLYGSGVCSKPCACASRMSTSGGDNSSYGTAREKKTGSPCFRTCSPACWSGT